MSVKNDTHARLTANYTHAVDTPPKGKSKRIIHKRARAKDKQSLRQEIASTAQDNYDQQEYEWDLEVDIAMYCHYHGPCESCKRHKLEEEQGDSKQASTREDS